MIDLSKIPLIPNGFVERWLEYFAPFESADSYALAGLLAVASAAVDGRILVNVGGEPCVYPNIYVLLYGPSGARKGTAMRHALWLLGEAMGDDTPVLPRSFTMEALKLRLAIKSEETGKGTGLIPSDEFSDLIGGAKYKEGNTRFLTDIWDCPPVYSHDTVAHSYREIISPYISGLWSSSPDWLEQTDPKTLAGGFLRRLLMIVEYGPKKREANPRRNEAIFAALVKRFREVLGPEAFHDGARMHLSDEAHALKKVWYDKVLPGIAAQGEKEGHFASCMEAHALKTGALIHLLEGGGPEELAAPALAQGQKFIEAIVPSMFQAYASLAPTAFARLKACIVRIVKTAGGSISERDLSRAVQATVGVKPMEYVQALEVVAGEGGVVRSGGKVLSAQNAKEGA